MVFSNSIPLGEYIFQFFNALPLWAFPIAMQARWSNTDGIAQRSMSRATPAATEHRHWVVSCSKLPQRPPGQQQTKQWWKHTPILLAILMSMATRQYVQGFTRSHRMPPLGEDLLRLMLLGMAVQCFCAFFSWSTLWKTPQMTSRPHLTRGVTYQTNQKDRLGGCDGTLK